MDDAFANYLLKKTREDYNLIADQFSNTRKFIWPELKNLVRFCRNGERILDLGCGNGRLAELFQERAVDYLGVDWAEKLIEKARKRYPARKFQKANALNLPLPSNYFDKIFSIAVFHHLPSKKLRIKFLREVKRVLKPDGLLILTVWNLCQRKFLKYHLKHFFLKLIGRSKLDFKDIFYPWKGQKGEVLAERYLHCFTIRELKKLVKGAGLKIKEIGFLSKKRKNIYLVAKK